MVTLILQSIDINMYYYICFRLLGLNKRVPCSVEVAAFDEKLSKTWKRTEARCGSWKEKWRNPRKRSESAETTMWKTGKSCGVWSCRRLPCSAQSSWHSSTLRQENLKIWTNCRWCSAESNVSVLTFDRIQLHSLLILHHTLNVHIVVELLRSGFHCCRSFVCCW